MASGGGQPIKSMRTRGQRPSRGLTALGHLRTIPKNMDNTSAPIDTKVMLLSNFVKLNSADNSLIFQYEISFEPNVDSSIMRRKLLYEHKEYLGNAFIFDGHSNMKSKSKLDNEEFELSSIRSTDNETIRITFKYTGTVSYYHAEMIRLFNTQMKRNLRHLKYILIGRQYFDVNSKISIPEHQLDLWQGISTAVNHYDAGALCVIDNAFKVVRQDTVLTILKEILTRNRSNYGEEAKRELVGCVVMTSYNNRTYRIDDIDFDKDPQYAFEKKGESITIKDYYAQQYNIKIHDERQPLLQCLPSARDRRAGMVEWILLVPELCLMTGLTEKMRNDFRLKSRLTSFTKLDPMSRVQRLKQFIQTLKNNAESKKELEQWNVKMDDNLVQVSGRLINPESIMMHNENPTQQLCCDSKTADFTRVIRGKMLKKPVQLQFWGIIAPKRDEQLANSFASMLFRVCTPMGIQMNRPKIVAINDDRTSTYVETLKRVPSSIEMVVAIVPNNNKDRYDAIKKITCIEHPVASQVVVVRTLSKEQMLMSVCTKIGYQMAAKLGSEIWYLSIPPQDTAVVGFDWYRDTARKGEAAGGFVISLNQTFTKWFSHSSFHTDNTSLSSNFNISLVAGLKEYAKENGRLPNRLIIYRDGVSEGQIQHVFESELNQVRQTLNSLSNGENIRFAFVIVTKRVAARFFASNDGRQFSNPLPGTVVDTVVTRKERFDFYLVSQSVRQGTVAPTMYNVIEDETNWKPQHHQQLAYKLTHLYYNWAGTIRVPAPVMYAYKLAFLTANSLHREPNVSLSNRLFYL